MNELLVLFKEAGPYLAFLLIVLGSFRYFFKYHEKREAQLEARNIALQEMYEAEKIVLRDLNENEKKDLREYYEKVIKRLAEDKEELQQENKELYEARIKEITRSQELLAKILPYLKGEDM